MATTHFFLSKWVGNNTNARQISPVSGKRKQTNAKPFHASSVFLCSPCNRHWRCWSMCVPQTSAQLLRLGLKAVCTIRTTPSSSPLPHETPTQWACACAACLLHALVAVCWIEGCSTLMVLVFPSLLQFLMLWHSCSSSNSLNQGSSAKMNEWHKKCPDQQGSKADRDICNSGRKR